MFSGSETTSAAAPQPVQDSFPASANSLCPLTWFLLRNYLITPSMSSQQPSSLNCDVKLFPDSAGL